MKFSFSNKMYIFLQELRLFSRQFKSLSFAFLLHHYHYEIVK